MEQKTYPQLFDICPLTMRTQAILHVKDVTSIIPLFLHGGGSSPLVAYPS